MRSEKGFTLRQTEPMPWDHVRPGCSRVPGVEQCLIDWAMGDLTDGFKLLIEKGLPELTTEYLVVKHASRFPTEVVNAAQARLAHWEVDL